MNQAKDLDKIVPGFLSELDTFSESLGKSSQNAPPAILPPLSHRGVPIPLRPRLLVARP